MALGTGKLKVVVVVNQQYPPTKVTNVALATVCCKVEVVVATYPANYYRLQAGRRRRKSRDHDKALTSTMRAPPRVQSRHRHGRIT